MSDESSRYPLMRILSMVIFHCCYSMLMWCRLISYDVVELYVCVKWNFTHSVIVYLLCTVCRRSSFWRVFSLCETRSAVAENPHDASCN